MKFLLILLFLFLTDVTFGGEIQKVLNPIEVKQESLIAAGNSEVPKVIEGLQWNRWTSKNFVVLALDDNYAQFLHNHLEVVKTWTLKRWGLSDVDYSVPCKFICVDDPSLFYKLKTSLSSSLRDAFSSSLSKSPSFSL